MILKSYKDLEKQQQSHWIQEMMLETVEIEEYMVNTVQNR